LEAVTRVVDPVTARARVETDWMHLGVRIWLGNVTPAGSQVIDFAAVAVEYNTDPAVEPDAQPLRLSNEEARALYGALADHFGHNGTDTRALRQDYDAERARVDQFITALTRSDQ
jgi:hypothetical protein